MTKGSASTSSSTPSNRENGGPTKRRSMTSPPVSSPFGKYFSRRRSVSRRDLPEIPTETDFVGIYSPFALLWGCVFLTVPLSYLYIFLVLLRELCVTFPETVYAPLEWYVPVFAKLITAMKKSSLIVELWCVMEAVFYVCLKLHIIWLQSRDPLEASLSAAPMMELPDRRILWQRMMDAVEDDPVTFLTGWFFDEPDLSQMSQYDVRDFVAWSMFESRHQEHLTTAELEQLEDFVQELEHRISLQLYGEKVIDKGDVTEDNDDEPESPLGLVEDDAPDADEHDPLATSTRTWRNSLPEPSKKFHFHDEMPAEESNFFSNLYESYRARYEQVVKNAAEFHPMEDIRNMVHKGAELRPVTSLRSFMAEAAQHAVEAEESAKATASHMYQSVIPTGSQMDKHLTAMSHATYGQMVEAWNSVQDTVKNMSERLETARFLSKQRQMIRQQMKGYRVMLNRMREMSSGVPSKQMVSLMRRITECNEAMERLESRAQSAFVKATGFARKNLSMITRRKEPQRYAMYSSDPLMGIALYPLGFHLLVLGGTEIPLRVMMSRRGFKRCTVGPVAYYFHPGRVSDSEEEDSEEKTPIVFVHGVGIGLIPYIRLIDDLLETGRAIFLPEIPYVSSFRPWQSPDAVLAPAVVCSTMTAMLATHGYLRATWAGHSYGTSWLAYLCKYASSTVAALLFLDPVCFCLHVPRLTKSFVYMRADVGTVAYVVRTDVIVNWTIQRSFPWSWIILFLEQIDVPCSVFLSEKDALVPSGAVEDYFRKRDVPIQDFDCVQEDHFQKMMNCTVFRGDGHGDWTERAAATVPTIVKAVTVLCERAEAQSGPQDER